MTTVNELDLQNLHLDKGGHGSPDEGHCLLEVVSMFAKEPFGDSPQCVSPYLRSFGIALNDRATDTQRQDLRRFITVLPGTAGDGKDTLRRYIGADHAIRVVTPRWLDRANLSDLAAKLRALEPITSEETWTTARKAVNEVRDVTWPLRQKRYASIREAVREALKAHQGAVADAAAAAVADAVAVAVAVAVAAAVAAAAAVADAVAAAVADAAADAVAVADAAAVADAVAVAVAVADAVADVANKRWWAIRDEVYMKVRAIYEERYAELLAESWDDALALVDRLIDPHLVGA